MKKPNYEITLKFKVVATREKYGFACYTLFGNQTSHICLECEEKGLDGVRECFLSQLSFLIDNYGLEKCAKLAPDAKELKKRILESVEVREVNEKRKTKGH